MLFSEGFVRQLRGGCVSEQDLELLPMTIITSLSKLQKTPPSRLDTTKSVAYCAVELCTLGTPLPRRSKVPAAVCCHWQIRFQDQHGRADGHQHQKHPAPAKPCSRALRPTHIAKRSSGTCGWVTGSRLAGLGRLEGASVRDPPGPGSPRGSGSG